MRKSNRSTLGVSGAFKRRLPDDAVHLFPIMHAVTVGVEVLVVAHGDPSIPKVVRRLRTPSLVLLDDQSIHPRGPAMLEAQQLCDLAEQVEHAAIVSSDLYLAPIAQVVASSLREMNCLLVQTTQQHELAWANALQNINPSMCVEIYNQSKTLAPHKIFGGSNV